MVPFVSVIYVKSVHQTRFVCLGENSALIDSGIFYEPILDDMRVSFGDKSSVVVVHDSCTCGLLFCSMRFLLFAETPSSYGAPWEYDKVLESVDNNEFFERDNPLLHF